jgi:hypothetical protein
MTGVLLRHDSPDPPVRVPARKRLPEQADNAKQFEVGLKTRQR